MKGESEIWVWKCFFPGSACAAGLGPDTGGCCPRFSRDTFFCRLDVVQSGKAARYAPGVKDFVKFGSRIAEVGEDVIQAIRDRCPGGVAEIRPRPYRSGEAVMIKEGPFAGLEAVFERDMAGSERVAVLLELLGRQTRLVLLSEMISRI